MKRTTSGFLFPRTCEGSSGRSKYSSEVFFKHSPAFFVLTLVPPLRWVARGRDCD